MHIAPSQRATCRPSRLYEAAKAYNWKLAAELPGAGYALGLAILPAVTSTVFASPGAMMPSRVPAQLMLNALRLSKYSNYETRWKP